MEQKNPYILEEFKSGAFVSLSPILPILISYDPHVYVNNNSNIVSFFINTLNTTKQNYNVTILDPIYPIENESINDFKIRVYNIMNEERKKIIVEDIPIPDNNKKIFTIIIFCIILSYFIFSKKINFIILIILIVLLLITITLRNKDDIYNYLYKNFIYIISIFFTIYSTFTSNYLLFLNSIIYPFIYKYFSK